MFQGCLNLTHGTEILCKPLYMYYSTGLRIRIQFSKQGRIRIRIRSEHQDFKSSHIELFLQHVDQVFIQY